MERTGTEALAAVLRGLSKLNEGADAEAVAEEIWPDFKEAVVRAQMETVEELSAGVREWREKRHESSS